MFIIIFQEREHSYFHGQSEFIAVVRGSVAITTIMISLLFRAYLMGVRIGVGLEKLEEINKLGVGISGEGCEIALKSMIVLL